MKKGFGYKPPEPKRPYPTPRVPYEHEKAKSAIKPRVKGVVAWTEPEKFAVPI